MADPRKFTKDELYHLELLKEFETRGLVPQTGLGVDATVAERNVKLEQILRARDRLPAGPPSVAATRRGVPTI